MPSNRTLTTGLCKCCFLVPVYALLPVMKMFRRGYGIYFAIVNIRNITYYIIIYINNAWWGAVSDKVTIYFEINLYVNDLIKRRIYYYILSYFNIKNNLLARLWQDNDKIPIRGNKTKSECKQTRQSFRNITWTGNYIE